MNITIRELIAAIEEATIDIKVMVPSQDYYHPGEPCSGSITVVDPYKLIEALKEMME